MALTDYGKIAWRNGLADEAAYAETVAILEAGTQPNTLTENAKIVLGNALGLDRVKTEVVAAFESGGALSDEGKETVRRMVGYDPIDEIVTHIGAIA
jgi:hypothetical protein